MSADNSAADSLAQARGIRPVLRSDLRISRQLSHDEPVYVVHDPIVFRSHRLNGFQYNVLTALDASLTLGESFGVLVIRGEFSADEESVFFELVNALSRLGLVVLPGLNGASLFQQHQKIKAAKRKGKLLGILFLQVPLVNPDRFLTRTVNYVSWLFSRAFFCVWLVAMIAAGAVLATRFSDVIQPLNGILATQNLVFLWLAFVVLKVWHELGHGYACKVFGGYVPEMGTILIAGTPAAFVDATSAWSFPERYKRLVVMCGGMFFESLVFIPCVFIWAFSASPVLASCAYQLFVMASVVTLLFNANPLMKFDGYFITSELLGLQNLRPRADAQIKRILASIVVGVRLPPSQDSLKTQILLVTYGISAMVYKFFLVISIAMLVATKFPIVGLGLAAFHVLTTVGLGAKKMASYLLTSKQTEPVRLRARIVAVLVFVAAPTAACFLPVPFGVVTQGIVAATTEYFVNVDTPGHFHRTLVDSGESVEPGSVLVQLQNERIREDLATTRARLAAAEQRWQVLQQLDTTEARRQLATVKELQQQVHEKHRLVRQLSVATPGSGRVIRLAPPTDRGMFLREGTPLAVVVDGQPLLRTWVNEEQLGSIRQDSGTVVRFRIPGRSTVTHTGTIISVEPAAEDVFRNPALTHVAGGEILVDPTTSKPIHPIFQIDIKPNDASLRLTEHGARVNLQLPRRTESIAAWTVRKCTRFVHKLLAA